jgi:hypothetical protein
MLLLGAVLLVEQRTGSLAFAGLASGCQAIGESLGTMAQGWLLDRYDKRMPFMAAAVLSMIAAVLLLAADSPATLVGCFFLLGLSTPPIAVWMRGVWPRLYPDTPRLHALGASWEMLVSCFVTLLGTLLLAGSSWLLGVTAALLIAAGMRSAAALLLACLPIRTGEGRTLARAAKPARRPASAGNGGVMSSAHTAGRVPSARKLRLARGRRLPRTALVIAAAAIPFAAAESVVLLGWLVEAGVASPEALLPLISAATTLSSTLAMLLRPTDKLQTFRQWSSGFLLVAGIACVLIIGPPVWLLFGYAALMGWWFAQVNRTGLQMIAHHAEQGAHNRAYAAHLALYNVLYPLVSTAAGWLADIHLRLGAALAVMCLLIPAVISAWLARTPAVAASSPQREREAASPASSVGP